MQDWSGFNNCDHERDLCIVNLYNSLLFWRAIQQEGWKTWAEEQNFEKAVELRDKIKNLEQNVEKISKLQKELDEISDPAVRAFL